jgi:predicted transcriptional regulator of viral defense system
VITINTILSRRDLTFLEAVIARYGYLVNISEMKSLFNELSEEEIHQRIGLLVKRGWLVRIKQGFYSVANLESHNFSNISPLIISSIFVPDSYVSFEYALNYHGYFDQMPETLTAVTPQKSKRYCFQDITYRFIKTQQYMMFGYTEEVIDGKRVAIAKIEKVLLDYLNFRVNAYSVDLVLEKIGELKEVINLKRIIEYAASYPVSTQRRLGYLLDLCEIKSDSLHEQVKIIAGYAKLTKDSNQFNAKWRIYYENRFTKQSPAIDN